MTKRSATRLQPKLLDPIIPCRYVDCRSDGIDIMTTSPGRLGRRTPEDRARFLRGQTSADADILTAEGVAKLLHCTVDAVMRIPDAALPAHRGPGKHLLYLRDEVIEYVRRRARSETNDVIEGRLVQPALPAPVEPLQATDTFDFSSLRRSVRKGVRP